MTYSSFEMTFEDECLVRRSLTTGKNMQLQVPAFVAGIEFETDGSWWVSDLSVMTTDDDGKYIHWDTVQGNELILTASLLVVRHQLAIDDEVAEALRAEGIKPELPEGPSHRERV